MRLIQALAAVLLVVALDPQHLARADNWGSPMTFVRPYTIIFADGDIESDTPGRLEQFLTQDKTPVGAELYLTSRGGNLEAGLKMGEIIRAHRLHTTVGAHTKIAGLYEEPTWVDPLLANGPYPGYCISACTFAFLGGVERKIWDGSFYAVHQAAMECQDPGEESADKTKPDTGETACPRSKQAFSEAQSMLGGLAAYVQEMGVDPAFLTEMSAADPSKVNRLSELQMKKYKTIYSAGGTKWVLETTATGEIYLQETDTRAEFKTNYIRFFCRRDRQPKLVIVVIYDPANAGGSEDVQRIINSSQEGLRLLYYHMVSQALAEHAEMVLGPDEVIRYPFRTEDGKIELVLVMTGRILDVVHQTEEVQLSNEFQLGAPLISFGAVSLYDPIDRTRFDGFTASCR